MPNRYGTSYPARRGSSYSGNYRYQQPSVSQYESFFEPIPVEFLQQNLQQHQGAYDQAFAGALAAKEAALQQEVALDDQIYRGQIIDQSMQDMDKVAQEKYGGDYGRASKEIARKVTELRSDPFWERSKYLKGQQEMQQKFMLENPDSHLYNDVMKIGAYDPELGQLRSPEQLNFEAEKKGDWQKSVELQFKDITANTWIRKLKESGIDGYSELQHVSEIKEDDLRKLLDDHPEMIDSFLENNTDYERSKTRLGGLGSDEVKAEAREYILGNILDKPVKSVRSQLVRQEDFGDNGSGKTKMPIPGEPKLLRTGSINSPVDEATLVTRREGTIDQVLKGNVTSAHMQSVVEADPKRFNKFKENASQITEEFKAQGLDLGADAEALIPTLVNRAVNDEGYDMVDLMQDLDDEGYLTVGTKTEKNEVGRDVNVMTYTPKGSDEVVDRIGMGIKLNNILQSDAFQELMGEKDYINSLSGEEVFNSDVLTPAAGTDAQGYLVEFFGNQLQGINSDADIQDMGMQVWKDQGKTEYGGTKTAENRRARKILEEIGDLSTAEAKGYRIGILPGDTNDPPRMVINTPSREQLRMPIVREAEETPIPLLEVGIRDNAYRRMVSDMQTPELINSDIDYHVERFLNQVPSAKGVPLKDIMGGGSEAPGTVYRKGPSEYEYVAEDDNGKVIARFGGTSPSEVFSQMNIDNETTYLQSVASQYATPTQKQQAALSGVTSWDDYNQMVAAMAAMGQ